MSTLTITRGGPGTGKTAWAKRKVAHADELTCRVGRGPLRQMMFGGGAAALTPAQESLVGAASRAMVVTLLRRHVDVVVDDTNLHPRSVLDWRKAAEFAGAGFEVHEMQGSGGGQSCLGGAGARPQPQGEPPCVAPQEVFHDEDLVVAPYVPLDGTPEVVVVDVDGAASFHNNDVPHDSAVELLDCLRDADLRVVFFSNREERHREGIEAWLDEHVRADGDGGAGRDQEPLFMRTDGDSRREVVVKADLFNRHVRHRYDVRFVMEGRSGLADMWRRMHVPCLQVTPGDA